MSARLLRNRRDNMTETGQQPLPGPLTRRRFQYGLRTIFGVTLVTVVFFSVACSLGYVDAVVALAAFGVLVGVVQYPRRVHLATGLLLTLVAGTLLWANLRPTGWQEEFNVAPPDQLDPVTQAMFWRGWPVCPCMICLIRSMKFQPDGCFPAGALVLDGVVFVIALLAVKAACGCCFRRQDE